MSTDNTATMEAPAAAAPSVNGKAKAKSAAKKAPAKAAKPAASGPTVRERVFKLINAKPSTGPAIAEKLQLSGIPSFLKDEGVTARPRIRRQVQEGVRGVVYSLTALGKADLAAGKVNSNAAEPSGGKDWPASR